MHKGLRGCVPPLRDNDGVSGTEQRLTDCAEALRYSICGGVGRRECGWPWATARPFAGHAEGSAPSNPRKSLKKQKKLHNRRYRLTGDTSTCLSLGRAVYEINQGLKGLNLKHRPESLAWRPNACLRLR